MDRLLRAPQADRGSEDYPEDQMRLSEGAIIDILRVDQVSAYKLKLFELAQHVKSQICVSGTSDPVRFSCAVTSLSLLPLGTSTQRR